MDPFQSILIGTIVILIFVAAIILFVVVYQQRLARHREKMLKIEAEYQHDLLEVSVESQEKERERIARDLHDEIGAMLSTINLGVARFQKKTEPGSPGEAFSHATKALVDATSDQVRRLSRELLPATLSRFGLIETVRDLFGLIAVQGGFETEIEYLPGEGVLAPEQELGMYRIIQEATNNTLKYAEASHVSLRIAYTETGWLMVYQDNGKGFDLVEARERKSLGLKNMESRASVMGGKVEVESGPDMGTSIRVRLPKESIQLP